MTRQFFSALLLVIFAFLANVHVSACNQVKPCANATQRVPTSEIPYGGCAEGSTTSIMPALGIYFPKFPQSFHNCCNDHNVCYGSASSSKAGCDNRLKSCLSSAQGRIDHVGLKTFFAAVPALAHINVITSEQACDSYAQSQRKYVSC